MKKLQVYSVLALLLTLSLSSCEVIGGIFKAGMGFGIFLVIAIIGLVIFIVAKIMGAGK